MAKFCWLFWFAVALSGTVDARAAASSVFLDDWTTSELAAGLLGGVTTVIIPVGGTEQSGPHLALGKHNTRVMLLAGRIAQQLGNTVVAPVLAYVPEGRIDPPTEHMRFAGTISVPEAAFKAVLEGAARSLRQHGFRDVLLIGDHGGYQRALQDVTTRLNREWAKTPVRVHFVGAYYVAAQSGFGDALKARGLSAEQVGSHAGSADTSLQLALAPTMVRPGLFAHAAQGGRSAGTSGDPRAASVHLGQMGVDLVISRSVAAIRTSLSSPR